MTAPPLSPALAAVAYIRERVGGPSGRHDPQTVKHVWHYIARFGTPNARSPASR